MSSKIISVVIPCYNSENFIEDAIESVLNQNYSDSIEIIVVDDGSIDKTRERCMKYIESGKIKYFKIKNHGAGYARNYGIKHAAGKWLMFLDADDLLLIDSNNYVISALLQNETRDILYFGKVQTNMELTDEPIISLPQKVNQIKNNIPKLEFWTCIYKTTFLKEDNVSFFEYREQDIETAFRYRAFSKTNAIKSINMPLIVQRNNLNSNTHTWNRYVLYSVKAKVYYQLFSETSVINDKKQLLRVVLGNLFAYYKLSMIEGYQDDKTFQDIHKILEKLKSENISLNIKYIFSTFIDTLIYKRLFVPRIKNKTKEIANSDAIKYSSDVDTIMLKLKKISSDTMKNLIDKI